MIEQLAITTTPKYNFPQDVMGIPLPQRFTELSVYSLRHNQRRSFQLNQQESQQDSLQQGLQTTELEKRYMLKPQPIPLNLRMEETTVAAVDTSSMKIGETDTGVLIAIRGANVWKHRRKYRYLRFGPFIFHVTEESRKEVYNTIQNAYFSLQRKPKHQSSPSLSQMQTRIASLLEKWLQKTLSETLSNGLILFDGSLTSGMADSPTQQIAEILGLARESGNVVLAFSKMTRLSVNGYRITDSPSKHKPPYLLEMAGMKPKPPLSFLGDIYVARLARGCYSFRLDIDKQNPFEQRIEAVEKLLGNDVTSQGYPETLRLAHIYCTFTANEVIAMQHFIARRYRLRIVNRPDMHRLLFGPFGKGEN